MQKVEKIAPRRSSLVKVPTISPSACCAASKSSATSSGVAVASAAWARRSDASARSSASTCRVRALNSPPRSPPSAASRRVARNKSRPAPVRAESAMKIVPSRSLREGGTPSRSILLTITIRLAAGGVPSNRSAVVIAPSTTLKTRSARASSARARRMPSPSTTSADSRKPAVSARVKSTPYSTIDSRSTSRVVPGMSVTIARSLPASAFSRLDLPTLGSPTITACMPSVRRAPRRAASSKACKPCVASSNNRSITGFEALSAASSEKSIAASISTRRRTIRFASTSARRENSPSSDRKAARACASERAAIRSATASAWLRSSLPFRNARSENSPARAVRAPNSHARRTSASSTTGLPCACSSSTSSPVNECGAAKNKARPRSIAAPSVPANAVSCARRGSGAIPHNAFAIARAPPPEIRTTPMPPRPGGVAVATMVSLADDMRLPARSGPCARVGPVDLAGDVPLLAQHADLAHHVIEGETGGEEEEQHREQHRHHLHHLGLGRIHALHRRQELRTQHGQRIQDRQDEQRIGRGQVRHPQERRVAQLDAEDQHVVQREEDRQDDQVGQAARHRIDLLLLVQLHHCLLVLLLVVAEALLQCLQAGLQLAHARAGLELRFGQLPGHGLDQQHQHDDREAPVADQTVQKRQELEHRLRDHGRPAVIDRQLQAGSHLPDLVLQVRPDVQPCRTAHRLVRRGRQARANGADQIARFAVRVVRRHLDAGKLLRPFLVGDPCRHEKPLGHRDPAAGDALVQRLLLEDRKSVV